MTDLHADWPIFTGPVTHEDIHWRLPDGTLACGARHLSALTQSLYFTCCRIHPAVVTCTPCLEAATEAGAA